MKRLTTLSAAIALAGAVGLSIVAPATAETLRDGAYAPGSVGAPLILNSDRASQQGAVAELAEQAEHEEFDYPLPYSYSPGAYWDRAGTDRNSNRRSQQNAAAVYVDPPVAAAYDNWPLYSTPYGSYGTYVGAPRVFEFFHFGRHGKFGLRHSRGKRHAPFFHHKPKKRFVFKNKGGHFGQRKWFGPRRHDNLAWRRGFGRHFGGRHFTNRPFGNRHSGRW